MISRPLLFLVVCLRATVLYGMGAELQFIAGSDLHKEGVYDGIPETFRERVVVFPTGGRPDAVSFVYCTPYEELKDLIREHFEGKATLREVIVDSQPKQSAYYPSESNKQLVAQEANKREAAGFRTDKISKLEIVFPKYNIIADGNQSSSLTMQFVNSQNIFGTPGSILTVVRLDDTIEQMRTFHFAIPLLKKTRSELRIVTDTETKMIQELDRSTQKNHIEAVLTLTNGDPYASFDSLVKFRTALDICHRKF